MAIRGRHHKVDPVAGRVERNEDWLRDLARRWLRTERLLDRHESARTAVAGCRECREENQRRWLPLLLSGASMKGSTTFVTVHRRMVRASLNRLALARHFAFSDLDEEKFERVIEQERATCLLGVPLGAGYLLCRPLPVSAEEPVRSGGSKKKPSLYSTEREL